MILFLDIEHPKALEDSAYRTERRGTMEKRRSLFEEVSGEPCRVCHYSEFRQADLRSPEVSALVTSGNRSLWEEYDLDRDFAEFRRALDSDAKPVLGICGGHQLMGMLLGGESAPMRTLRAGEPDPHPEYAPGFFKEWGYATVETSPDPLFAGLEQPIVVTQWHFWHLVRLPASLQVIARNQECPIQAVRHRERPVYGVQFHPEFHDQEHPDGRRVLENFFSM